MYLTNMMLDAFPIIMSSLAALILGGALGFISYKLINKNKTSNAKLSASKMIEDALTEIKNMKKEASLEAIEEAHKLKTETELELKDRKFELQKIEDRLHQREDIIISKEKNIEEKSSRIDERLSFSEKKLAEADKLKDSYDKKLNEVDETLQTISKMTIEEAKNTLISKYENEAKIEASKIAKNIEYEAKENAMAKAKDIITLAVQKCAAEHASEICVTTVALPNEEVKGKIIGREGRNIRSLEQATGVDLIIDDTPETVVISGFDPVRREIARLSLEKLIFDGRIHPGRIEEVVEKVKRDMEITIKEAGEDAVFQTEIIGLHPELIKTIGRLKYRTSYGQNILKHAVEVSLIAGLLAQELGANIMTCKRGGLLHDIGKALDHESEGTHVSIGVELARKYKESEAVVHCIEAHHFDVEFKSLEAIIVQAADAISGARPGARRENLENYIKRLEQIESITKDFKGVDNCYAIQAGREVRVIVNPTEIDDANAFFLAKDIAKRIEDEMQYPGQIKVNVIRETRNSAIAK